MSSIKRPYPQPETWLRPNTRLSAFQSLLFGGLGGGLGLMAALLHLPLWFRIFLIIGAIACGWLAVVSLLAGRRPRIARSGGALMFYIHGWVPLEIPLELVECFFHGQAPLDVTARSPGGNEPIGLESLNIVVRIAERASEWQQRDVDRNVAKWCGGYISLLGTQCEPITPQLLQQLNGKLAAAHRELRNSNGLAGHGAPIAHAERAETLG